MMLWTKIKIGAAIAAATAMLAGTGSFLVIEALAQKRRRRRRIPMGRVAVGCRAVDVAPAAASASTPGSVAPFDSPFLELVGCRIKEPSSPEAAGRSGSATERDVGRAAISGGAMDDRSRAGGESNGYTISVTPTNDPAGAKTVQADKSASDQPLVNELGQVGEYEVKVSAVGADSQAVASAAVHVVVNPLPSTQIVIDDVQPDGTIDFTNVMQYLNFQRQSTEGRWVHQLRFCASGQDDRRPGSAVAIHRAAPGEHLSISLRADKASAGW